MGTKDPPGTVRGVVVTEDPPGTVRDVMGTELSNDVPRTNETPAKELDAAVFLKIIRVYGWGVFLPKKFYIANLCILILKGSDSYKYN